MANLIGAYRLKTRPTLPQTAITQSLDFVISYAGQSISCTSIRVDSTGIAYFVQAVNGGDVTEPEYVLVYSAEQGVWVASYARALLVEKEQSVSDEFDLWLANNLWEQPEITGTIEFTVNGKTFTAAKGASWFLWLNSSLASYEFAPTEMELVAYMGCIVSYGGQDVNMYDFIVAGANYTIKPQINVNIQMSDDVNMNLLFAKRGIVGDFVLYANQTYEVDLVCDTNYHVIPQRTTRLNDYVEYELINDKLIISVGDIPDNFIGLAPLEINIVIARKTYDKLTELTTALEGEKGRIVELAPQYKVNINGSYCLKKAASISKEIIGYDDNLICGISMPFEMMEAYATSDTPNVPEMSEAAIALTSYLLLVGIDPSRVILNRRVYIMDEWLVAYLNQELSHEDLIGQPIMVGDYDVDKIIDYYIAEWAKKANISVTDVIAQIETETGASEGSAEYKAYVISEIEKKNGSIELIRYVTQTTVDEKTLALVDAILKMYKTNVYRSVRAYQGEGIQLLIFYAVGTSNTVIKNTYSYSPGSVMYSLFNGETLIEEDFVVSDANDFNLTSSGESEKLDGRYLVVDSYVAPTDRYTPGTLYVSERTCLAGDTLIEMADGSLKRIDQLQLGDIVKTVAGSERVIFTDSYAHKQKARYTDYHFNDGTTLRVIKDHRVYSPKHRKFVHITTLRLGDEIVKNGGTKATLIKKETVTGESIAHYTLFTENLNDYFANGILCGNIFSNIKIGWIRKMLLKLYYNFVLCKELKRYGRS